MISSSAEHKQCAGKNCRNIVKKTLKIMYINKTGNFCDSCSKDLLQQQLAIEIGDIVT